MVHVGNKLASGVFMRLFAIVGFLFRPSYKRNHHLRIQLIGFGVSVAYAGFDILAGEDCYVFTNSLLPRSLA